MGSEHARNQLLPLLLLHYTRVVMFGQALPNLKAFSTVNATGPRALH